MGVSKKIFTKNELDKRFENLLLIKKVFDELELDYFLSDGTLLGIYRDNDFIKWDNDVDISVKIEEFLPKYDLFKNKVIDLGFVLISEDKSNKRCFLSFRKDNSKFEIAAFLKDSKYRKSNLSKNEMAFKLLDSFFNVGYIDFRSIRFKTFENIEDYLKFQYGNWKIPKQQNYFTLKCRTNYFNPIVRLKYQLKKIQKSIFK